MIELSGAHCCRRPPVDGWLTAGIIVVDVLGGESPTDGITVVLAVLVRVPRVISAAVMVQVAVQVVVAPGSSSVLDRRRETDPRPTTAVTGCTYSVPPGLRVPDISSTTPVVLGF